jgi:hypothetical protein
VVPVFVALGYLAAGTAAGRHTLGDLVLYEDNLFLSQAQLYG